MARHILLVEYDGSAFQGFQLQPGLTTIQSELERALQIVLREAVRVQCSGRTDAGVHATGQVVHYDAGVAVPDSYKLCHALNALLPAGIAVRDSAPVEEDFHARFSCLAREYEYLIWNGPRRRSVLAGHTLWIRDPLDLEFCNQQLQALLGEQDFAAFTRAEYRHAVTRRCVDRADLRRVSDPIANSEDLLIFRIRANAFLHNMIRILLGTLLDLASGRLQSNMAEILASGDRTLAGQTAAPQGLFFRQAYYPPEVAPAVDWLARLADYPYRRPAERPADRLSASE